jgi:hypothetical protein
MLEVELTSELMILGLDGLQDKKKSIEDFYAKYDEEFPEEKTVEKRFRAVVDGINEAVGDTLAESEFQRPPLFYSLFGVVYHRLFGIPKVALRSPRKPMNQREARDLADAVSKLSELLAAAGEGEPVPRGYEEFVLASQRQTDNIRPRAVRLEKLYTTAF